MDSAHERHELRRIERWLAVNDPDLAAALSAPGAEPLHANRRSVRLTVDLAGVACVATGVLRRTRCTPRTVGSGARSCAAKPTG
ncbi:DUF3040 domain-containing protein [Lentzea atacamensis]|uniref:DUF3040 domain-containing protein n=1 Tax=Lentzea atacamensis TaxID=531938 RepID=UPI000DD42156|nr:DUF3040 domain-containing protein [Lentzea atacamensis]